MLLDSGHLELLAALTRHDTLASASAAIHLSPSAASRRLQEAERRLGFALTSVAGRSISLTPAGRVVADAAVATENQIAEAELAARWLGSGTERPLRIGVGFFDAIAWALPAPDTQAISITRLDRSGPDRALTNNVIDIAVDVRNACPPTSAVTLAHDELMLFVATDHPLAKSEQASAADISSFRYLGSALDPQPGFEFDAFFRPSGCSPTDITTIESLSCILDATASSTAVTIQPSRVVPEARTDLERVYLDRKLPVEWIARTSSPPSSAATEYLNARR